jgi:hypothetical protein
VCIADYVWAECWKGLNHFFLCMFVRVLIPAYSSSQSLKQ